MAEGANKGVAAPGGKAVPGAGEVLHPQPAPAGPPEPPPAVPSQRDERRPRPQLPPVTIEIADRNNRGYQWKMTGANLRGRWDSHNLAAGDQSEAGVHRCPQIPGMYVTVDMAARQCRVEDPLSFPENRTLLGDVNSFHSQVFRQSITFVAPTVREEVSDNDLATWLYWMVRAVRAGHARIVSGRLPEAEVDVHRLLPGAKIQKKFFDAAEQAVMAQVRDAAQLLHDGRDDSGE